MVYTVLPGKVNRVHVCYISSIFLYFHWDFGNRHFFMTKEVLLAFSNKVLMKSFWKIIFGSVSDDDTSVELENSVHWQHLMLYFLFFNYSSIFFSHAISSFLHGELINWTSEFYLTFCCTVLLRILNILIFMNRVILIICIYQLCFMVFHM